jgi:uncharacterized protein
MSPNKQLIEAYLASKDPSKVAPMLTDDAESVEWHDGVPAAGVRTQGKAALLQNVGGADYQTEITRMMEENNVVVVEGTARGAKEDGGFWTLRFCDIFEVDNGRVKRVTMYHAVPSDPA